MGMRMLVGYKYRVWGFGGWRNIGLRFYALMLSMLSWRTPVLFCARLVRSGVLWLMIVGKQFFVANLCCRF